MNKGPTEPTSKEIQKVFDALVQMLRSTIDESGNAETRERKHKELDLAAAAVKATTDLKYLKELFLSTMAVFYCWPSIQRAWDAHHKIELTAEMIFNDGVWVSKPGTQ
jgi:hypothetical protein